MYPVPTALYFMTQELIVQEYLFQLTISIRCLRIVGWCTHFPLFSYVEFLSPMQTTKIPSCSIYMIPCSQFVAWSCK